MSDRGLRHFAGQLWALTWANMRARYRKTVAGFVWVVLSPVIMFAVQAAVFKKFLNLEIEHYELFLLAGLLPWIFLSQSLQMSVTCFVTHGRLLKSYQVSPLVYLGAMVLDNLINFVAAFVLVLIPVVLWVAPHVTGLAGYGVASIAIVPLFFGASALSLLLATLNVFYRDTAFVLNFVLGIAFFLTPIFYPPQAVSGWARGVIESNILYYWIEPFRIAIYHFEGAEFVRSLLRSIALTGMMSLAALFVWRFKRNALYFNI